MEVLVRYILADGQQNYRDVPLSATQLRVGADINNELQWLGPNVGVLHATLTAAADGLAVRCESGCTAEIQSGGATEVTKSGTIRQGDSLTIDGNQLTLIAAPGGFDYALEVELNANVSPSLFQQAYRTDLAQTWLSRRRLAWGLLGAVIVLFLALPMINSTTKEGARVSEWLPSERMFSSGPLHEAHQLAIGDDCGACHKNSFERVQDEQCVACHTVADHIFDEAGLRRVATAEVGIGAHTEAGEQRCGTCHQEHNEPAHMVQDDSALCLDCHASGSADIPAVQAFRPGEHPAFKVEMPVPTVTDRPGGKVFNWSLQRTVLSEAKDQSNLKFPHDTHLNPQLVTKLEDNSGLGCADCHQPSSDPEHFEPIRMDTHCRDCHGLQFDPNDPLAELPHGSPTKVVETLEGYYLRKLVSGESDENARIRRRIPNRPEPGADCVGTAFECAQQFATQDAETQFGASGCNNCHEIFDNGGADLHSRFQVQPVKLGGDFLAHARFDHPTHMTLALADAEGSAACSACHNAASSHTSADVLIPDINVCSACHDAPGTFGKIGMECASCHSFHKPDTPILSFDTVRPVTTGGQ